MAVDRSLLAQALGKNDPNNYMSASQGQRNLQTGQSISQMAMDSSNFGSGQARGVGLAAQLATAGIGAFTQYRAQKDLNEQELASQEQFAKQFPDLADIASTLTPERRQAYTLEVIKASLPKAAEYQIISGEQGYVAVDKNNPSAQAQPVMGKNGQIIKPQKPASTTINVGEQQDFKNETQLRGEYSDKSKNFIGVKEGFEKVKESVQNPSPAGDISTVFAYMKTLDPQSTVREGEFAQLSKAKPLLEKFGLEALENVWKGEKLTTSQRNDIITKSRSLYDRASASQSKLTNQYTDIAKRNKLNPQNVIIDFSTTTGSASSGAAQSGFKVISVRDK
jgi:hypothetical protein